MEKLLNVKEVAGILGIGVSTVWCWQKNRTDFPKSRKIGQRVTRWKLSDVESFTDAIAHS